MDSPAKRAYCQTSELQRNAIIRKAYNGGPMASNTPLSWTERSVLRSEREQPYLSIQDIVVFVRDLDISKRFYLQQLGFELITEQRLPTGERWIEVAPPDGSANLALVEPKPDKPEYKLIGGYRWVLFMTEDVHAKYKEWSERGVHFLTAPETPGWGGTYTRFEDPDGNQFGLEGFDEVRRSLESRRQAHAAQPRNWKSRGRCRRGCFRRFNPS